MIDPEKFPHPVYADTVLAPLFEGVKTHYAASMMAINQAHLIMLVAQDILSPEQGLQIAKALAVIGERTDISALTYTGEHEDYFFVIEDKLKKRLGDDLGGMLHTARSRNDMDHTLFKMALRPRIDLMTEVLLTLARTMLAKARTEAGTLIVAYTHGQPAQPTTFGHYLAAALEVLIADIGRLTDARKAVGHSPMGAAAITTTGFPIDRQMVAALLGFEDVRRNSYGCIAAVDYVTGLYSALKLPFLHLGRLVQDFQFWTSFEVGQLHVPGSMVQISSIMPQKRNPVPIEHLRHLMSVTCGHCDTIVNTMHNTPFTDMNDSEGEVQQAGYTSFATGGRAVALMTALIEVVSINPVRVRANADAACITITELADTMVREDGLSFRQAHHIAAITAKTVIADGVPLAQGYDAFAKAFHAETNRPPSLDPVSYKNTVAPETFVARRNCFGGPAPDALADAFAAYEAQIDHAADSLAILRRQSQRADDDRLAAFAKLMEV